VHGIDEGFDEGVDEGIQDRGYHVLVSYRAYTTFWFPIWQNTTFWVPIWLTF
jgi:hypothetical protein